MTDRPKSPPKPPDPKPAPASPPTDPKPEADPTSTRQRLARRVELNSRTIGAGGGADAPRMQTRGVPHDDTLEPSAPPKEPDDERADG